MKDSRKERGKEELEGRKTKQTRQIIAVVFSFCGDSVQVHEYLFTSFLEIQQKKSSAARKDNSVRPRGRAAKEVSITGNSVKSHEIVGPLNPEKIDSSN